MYRCVTDIGEIRKYLSGAKIVAIDIETAPNEEWRDDPKAALDPHKAHIVGVSFASDGKSDSIYVPLRHAAPYTNADMQEMNAVLASLLTDGKITKIAHNLAFESGFFYAMGIIVQPPVYDTIAGAQMTLKAPSKFRELRDCGLKTLAPKLLDMSMASYEDVTGGRWFDQMNPEVSATFSYACADVDATLKLYHRLNDWFDKYLPKHRRIVEEVESPTAVYCGIMKYNGTLVDQTRMETEALRCARERKRLRDEIAELIGDVNIGENASTKEFKKYLYETQGFPVLKTTATSREAADDETMILLSEWAKEHRPDLAPLFKLIQDYRRYGKIKSTYIDGYLKYLNPVTECIHADLMPLATETGRFASRNPNLQNMPRSDSDSSGVRSFFVAPQGSVLLSLDFSQIELRVCAFYCRDARMLKTYHDGGDIHAQTTSVIYHIPLDEAKDKNAPQYKTRRTISKNCNFGVAFGLFPKGLQKTLHFKAGLDTSLAECERIIENLKTGYPALVRWQENAKKLTAVRKCTETILGRRRYLTDITSSDRGKKAFAERCAMNTPIQGTAADILKLALGRILVGLPERPWLKPLLQIHDELVFELPQNRVYEAVTFVKACMEACPFDGFDVPIVAEASVGEKFGEMKEVDTTDAPDDRRGADAQNMKERVMPWQLQLGNTRNPVRFQ
jgi:DNA polymerase-1